MLPLIIAGIVGLLPLLFTRMPYTLQRWMTHNPFSLSSSSSANHPHADLQAEPLYFHIDPGKIPDVDISVDGKVLPPLLFPIVSGPHCLAESDISPQPVCYAVVDDPEFFAMAPYRSDDPFVQSWDQLRASLAYLAGTRLAATLAICFVLALVIPFVPDVVQQTSNVAYTIASASFIFGYTAACHAVGMASVLLYMLDAVGWVLTRISGGDPLKTADDGEDASTSSVEVTWPVSSSTSADVSGLLQTLAPIHPSRVPAQSEDTMAIVLVSSNATATPVSSSPTINTREEVSDTSTSSLEVEVASPQSICEEPFTRAPPGTPVISPSPSSSVSALVSSGSGTSRPLSSATLGGLSLQALYTCSKQYQAQITEALPTSENVLQADSAPGTVSSSDMDTRRVRFNSDSITLRSSQGQSNQEISTSDAYSRVHADAAVLNRSLEHKEAEVERLERGALAPVSPLGFNLRTLNFKEVTPSPSPPSFAKYELPALRRMRTQSESPASLASPKTPVDGTYTNAPRVRSDSIDTPGPSIADSTPNWRSRRSRGATFSIMKQADVGSPLYPKSALRKTELSTSSPVIPASELADASAAQSTPIRMPLGPGGSPFKKRRAVSIAVKDDADKEPDWVSAPSSLKRRQRTRTRTRTSSRNDKENQPALWNTVHRAPRARLPSSGPSFLNM